MNLKRIVEKGLTLISKDERLIQLFPVSGGDINQAYYVQTEWNEYFVKANPKMKIDFFEFERKGISIIRNTSTIDVPTVLDCIEVEGVPMLWMEWIEGEKTKETDKLLGERLAALHLVQVMGYGLEGESYIGYLKEKNKLLDNWIQYYRDVRLNSQLERGRQLGTITLDREKKLMTLMDRLEEWIPKSPKPSLLHGDLWSGNWMSGQEGVPYLIDPAILYGDHEFELAFTELFGGFSNQFYKAYNSVYPHSSEYSDRKELYQLYYLLVHLNMFGESYGGSVDRILRRYVG